MLMNPMLNSPGSQFLVAPMLRVGTGFIWSAQTRLRFEKAATRRRTPKQSGISMIEVLVTLVILMVGLLGLAGLQMQGLRSEMESYQRVQALILLQDMVGRINANRANAASYVTNDIGVVTATNCTGTVQQRDICEWSDALKGAGEKSGTTSVGAMIGGRGCITQPSANTYLISVVWQGMGETFANITNLCGQNQYDNEAQRRVVSLTIRIGNLTAL